MTSDIFLTRRYFFLVITTLLLLGLFNGLLFLPVVLSMIGPPAEVIPKSRGEAIDPPEDDDEDDSEDAVEDKQRKLQIKPKELLRVGNVPRRHNSDASLSTIAEESQTYVSSSNNNTPQSSLNAASVFVEPQVVVETTSTSTSSTKVTATAKFKVEVHAPQPSSPLRRTSRRQRRQSGESSSTPSPVQSSLSSNEGDLGFHEK